MPSFPYAGLPDHQIWKRATRPSLGDVDPQSPGRFRFDRNAAVSSAGSCFALRIAQALRASGFAYLMIEDSANDGGAVYSARYGDIYTTLQLAQLAQRCVGRFVPQEAPWVVRGRFFDPFRPRVRAEGYASPAELEADRAVHLAATRRVITESDVFIFTLGLTETWESRADGAVFPLCPGAGIGTFDDASYAFRNLSVDENVAALETFLEIAWSLNPQLRVILTISPVPLAATIEPRHVIASTVYSKSVLRVAAEAVRARHALVDYFASYEIVTVAARNAFQANGRDVSEAAVARVMRSFFTAFTDKTASEPPAPVPAEPAALEEIDVTFDAIRAAAMAAPSDVCNEAYLATFITPGGRG